MEHIDQSGRRLDGIRHELEVHFRECFGEGGAPRAFSAPGRVNLMGAHLDYNGGPVLPLAIDRRVWALSRPRAGGTLWVSSLQQPAQLELDLARTPQLPLGDWRDYVLGVAGALRRRGAKPRGGQLLVGGDLPVGAGLSSSAALCLALCLALEELWGLELAPRQRVEVALEAERGFVGVDCGILDPFAISFARAGCALWLDTRRELHEYLPLQLGAVRLALVDSGTRRRLASGEYNARVRECERALASLRARGLQRECLAQVTPSELLEHSDALEPTARRRAQHIVGEVERTRAARVALSRGDFAAVGALMSETQTSLRELYEVSLPVLDKLVDLAAEVEGVHGGRLVGAGFGGCAAFLLDEDAVPAFERAVRNVNRTPLRGTSGVWILSSAEGPRAH